MIAESGAARGRCPDRSSKPGSACSPRVGWFDSIAAPFLHSRGVEKEGADARSPRNRAAVEGRPQPRAWRRAELTGEARPAQERVSEMDGGAAVGAYGHLVPAGRDHGHCASVAVRSLADGAAGAGREVVEVARHARVTASVSGNRRQVTVPAGKGDRLGHSERAGPALVLAGRAARQRGRIAMMVLVHRAGTRVGPDAEGEGVERAATPAGPLTDGGVIVRLGFDGWTSGPLCWTSATMAARRHAADHPPGARTCR
jgi:hypothetical protein